jgi:hypothetical protein
LLILLEVRYHLRNINPGSGGGNDGRHCLFGRVPSTCRAVRPVSNAEFRTTAATSGECVTCHGREGRLKFICRRDAFDAGKAMRSEDFCGTFAGRNGSQGAGDHAAMRDRRTGRLSILCKHMAASGCPSKGNGTVLSHALAISQIVCSPVRHKRFRTYTQERSQSKYARGEGLARQPLRQSTGSGLQLTLLLRCSTWTALMPVTRHHS